MATFRKGAPGVWAFKILGIPFLAIKNEAGFAGRNWDLYSGDGQTVLADQLATRQACYDEALMFAKRDEAIKALQWLGTNTIGDAADIPQPTDDEPERFDYVVDVYVPFCISVHADNAEMAAAMAVEDFQRSGLREQMDALVNADVDSAFLPSDSDYQTEVGEA